LVIGVTGHRNLRGPEIPGLRAQVREFFLGLRARYPELPLTVLCSLAAGGDQLVAQVAFELGLRVIAPLPMAPELYQEDFEEPAAREVFQQQVQQAEVLLLPIRQGADAAAVAHPGRERDLQYAQAGIFVSSHCHVLLALWDGRSSELLGGTAQVVAFHLHGYMPGPMERRRAALGMLGLDEETLVYRLPTGRDNADFEMIRDGRWLTSDQDFVEHTDLPQAFDLMFRRHADFNVDWHRYRDDMAAGPPPSPRVAECPINELFRVADWLASIYQRRVGNVLRVTYLLAALMGFALILYADVSAQDVIIYLFLAFFVAGIIVAGMATRREWHRKYIDYRALAEGLRVQSFWRRAGIVDVSTPSFAHDNFLQKQDVELGWIRNIMRAASLDGMLRVAPAGAPEVAAVIEEWIGTPESPGQLNYYLLTAARRTRLHWRSELLGSACLWLGIGISVLLAIFARQLDGRMQNLMVATMGVLSVAAAVHDAYAYKKADKELIKQYRFMVRIFSAARRRLKDCADLAEQRQVLRTLGEAALAEHAEWTLMHRERPLEHSRI
jgi:hypothetical protein